MDIGTVNNQAAIPSPVMQDAQGTHNKKQYGFTSLPLSDGDMELYERRDFIGSFQDTIKQQDILGQKDNAGFYRSSMQTYQRFVDRLNGDPGKSAPYDHLAKDGQIEFNGVVFVSDPKLNQLRLGDCSDPNKCLIIPLEGGGTLMVNHNSLGALKDAITMFSLADQRAIMQALTAYNKIKEVEKEIDDDTSSIGDGDGAAEAPVDPMQFIHDRIEEMFVKLQNGDIEPKFMIGSSALTQKEWEDMLEEFDSAEEALRKLMAEEAARKQAEDAKFEAMNASTESEAKQAIVAAETPVEPDMDARIDMMLSDTVWSRFSTGQTDDNGMEIEDIYVTAMDKDGIRCGKPGQEDYVWEIKFDNEQQYEKAQQFLDWAGGYMDNFRFAAHESFWNDFLGDNMDEDAFRDFLATSTKNGMPVYTYGDAENMYIDRDKAQWAKYMNRPGTFVAIEDIEKHINETVRDRQKNLSILPNPLSESPGGTEDDRRSDEQAMFCRYPGSELYSAGELARMLYEEMLMRTIL